VLSGDRLVCPWHQSCFHLQSGDALEPPALDGLPRFDVRVDGQDVLVRVPETFATHRPPAMADRDPEDRRVFVVLGAGAAGAYAVEALRAAGFTGRLVLLTQEPDLPYDRPNCSKDYLQGEAEEAWMPLRSAAFYAEHAVEVMPGRHVNRVDVAGHHLQFDDDQVLTYDTLILCTGGTPRRLDVPGADLDGVYTLRSYADSTHLREVARQARRAVVIGASFIGLEVAFSLRQLGLEVTVVAPESIPFARILGARVGRLLQAEHEKHGVRFVLEATVQKFAGEQAVQHVVLNDGTRIDTDFVVVGIGVVPATDVLHDLKLASDGSVVVDEYLRAGEHLYAAGDMARFPDWRTGELIRIEHWRLACQHGRLAGYNAAGRSLPYRGIPYFWTVHFDVRLRYVGHATEWDDILYDGDPQSGQFIAYYVKGKHTLAAAGVNRDRDMAAIHELMRREIMPTPDTLRQQPVDVVTLLRQAGG
jgi:NADPH-dependent 2,4-dienoyl-CoA reductase/sulfur reductase-like enzyme